MAQDEQFQEIVRIVGVVAVAGFLTRISLALLRDAVGLPPLVYYAAVMAVPLLVLVLYLRRRRLRREDGRPAR
jgi:membrane protein implicated in regulation of membrane protease activity